MSGPLDRVLSLLADAKKNGTGWTARCPAHDDKTASLSIDEGDDGRALLKCFAGCPAEAVVRAIGLELHDLFVTGNGRRRGKGAKSSGSTGATVQPSADGVTLARYAEAKRLPVEFLRGLGCRDLHLFGRPAVAIPYQDLAGAVTAVQFRCALTGDNRFRWKKGSKATLYGLSRLDVARQCGCVTLVEGASDAQTLWFHDEPALGLPGAATWKEDRDAAHLDGIAIIYVVVEPDRGGAAVLDWIAKSRIRDRVRLVRLDGAKDPSELYLRDPSRFRAAWAAARTAAVPWTDAAHARDEQRRAVAWRRCEALAREPRILDLVAKVVRVLGVVGEEKIVKLVYLSVTSRLLDKIVSVAVKGPSSVGKSYTVEQVLRLFPPSAFYVLSSMSERALVYDEEPLVHRMLCIYEAAGLHGDFVSYLVRSLLSEGRIVYVTVEKTKEGMRPRRIERPGPTGLIVTTTEVNLHPENETRLFSIVATDTPEQTKQVLTAMAGAERTLPDFGPWHALQEWLALSERRVVIPFAMRLADAVPAVAVRLRRDFGGVLALIRANAVLHQASRARDEKGAIVATLDDYAAVREIAADLVADGVGATVSKTVRETVAAVERLCAAIDGEDATVSVKDVARALKLDKSAASRRVNVAIDAGFLKNLEDKKGRPLRLVVGDPLPGDTPVLPDPKALAEGGCTVAGDAEGDRAPPAPAASPPSDGETLPTGAWIPAHDRPGRCGACDAKTGRFRFICDDCAADTDRRGRP